MRRQLVLNRLIWIYTAYVGILPFYSVGKVNNCTHVNRFENCVFSDFLRSSQPLPFSLTFLQEKQLKKDDFCEFVCLSQIKKKDVLIILFQVNKVK